MHLLTPEKYIVMRQNYNYKACSCKFSILQTGYLSFSGNYSGIFPAVVPSHFLQGINIRKFEYICQEVFRDSQSAMANDNFSLAHLDNLKNVASAIVFWKMSSQGGRAPKNSSNMLNKWNSQTAVQLLKAHNKKDLSLFRIGGVRIPTASAFLRFLFPEDFGIIDSRVVNNYTQSYKITNLNIRDDGYINDVTENLRQYNERYIPFLRSEAKWLNDQNITFQDWDCSEKCFDSKFRPCDIEMALF